MTNKRPDTDSNAGKDQAIINDVLCYRQDTDWVPYSPESMTVAYTSLSIYNTQLLARLEKHESKLRELKKVIDSK